MAKVKSNKLRNLVSYVLMSSPIDVLGWVYAFGRRDRCSAMDYNDKCVLWSGNYHTIHLPLIAERKGEYIEPFSEALHRYSTLLEGSILIATIGIVYRFRKPLSHMFKSLISNRSVNKRSLGRSSEGIYDSQGDQRHNLCNQQNLESQVEQYQEPQALDSYQQPQLYNSNSLEDQIAQLRNEIQELESN